MQPLPPTLVRSLHDMGDLQEGRNAHFEAQLNPVSDPTMKVEWYKDGKPITASTSYLALETRLSLIKNYNVGYRFKDHDNFQFWVRFIKHHASPCRGQR